MRRHLQAQENLGTLGAVWLRETLIEGWASRALACAALGLWHQVWVADDGVVMTFAGELKEGSMRLLGTQRGPKGGSMPVRMTFTPLASGDVRQFIENSKDGGKTWVPSFEGIYKRKKS